MICACGRATRKLGTNTVYESGGISSFFLNSSVLLVITWTDNECFNSSRVCRWPRVDDTDKTRVHIDYGGVIVKFPCRANERTRPPRGVVEQRVRVISTGPGQRFRNAYFATAKLRFFKIFILSV